MLFFLRFKKLSHFKHMGDTSDVFKWVSHRLKFYLDQHLLVQNP